MNQPEVTRHGVLDMQVCVPETFTDEEVVDFANRLNPAGTGGGWQIRKEGSEYLAGDPERKRCEGGRDDCVHIMLDC